MKECSLKIFMQLFANPFAFQNQQCRLIEIACGIHLKHTKSYQITGRSDLGIAKNN